MYLAKAHFKKQNFNRCKEITTKLIARYPQDMRLVFNLAQCLYQEATVIFRKDGRLVKETKFAINNLVQSKRLFQNFMSKRDNLMNLNASNENREVMEMRNRAYIEMYKVADETIKYIADLHESSALYLQHDQEQENKRIEA